jgi:hypothetical protein
VLSLAAILLSAASAASSPALTSTAPWWERITVTMTADGNHQSCRYETSLPDKNSEACDVTKAAADFERTSASGGGTQTKITFERRFTPGRRPDVGSMSPGDTLLGGQVMMLAIDGSGAVRACEVVAESGEAKPAYGCDEARSERFEAKAGRGTGEAGLGYLTVLVYGHEEHVA